MAGRPARSTSPVGIPPVGARAIPDHVVALLNVLPMASLVVDGEGNVLRTTPRAEALGLVRRDALAVVDVHELIRACVERGGPQEREIRVRRPPLGRGMLDLKATVASLSPGIYVVLVEDLAEERRVDAVRRDFVANVSHELKTPVGALALLAEAILSSADDQESVQRFAERMIVESSRLASLINDIIELSRLQGDDPLARAAVFEIDPVIVQAVDEVRPFADARGIELVVIGAPGAEMVGDRQQVLTALRNLVSNAVTYSPDHTRVAVAARTDSGMVEIDVKDQGIGIASHDLDRIFERFYRADPARSRATGGTGLGLSIVKHVCENHGGDVAVWSESGVGSTFTLRFPLSGGSGDGDVLTLGGSRARGGRGVVEEEAR
jgi:two-component system sensor histidine kinase SenX3